eukprot:403342705
MKNTQVSEQNSRLTFNSLKQGASTSNNQQKLPSQQITGKSQPFQQTLPIKAQLTSKKPIQYQVNASNGMHQQALQNSNQAPKPCSSSSIGKQFFGINIIQENKNTQKQNNKHNSQQPQIKILNSNISSPTGVTIHQRDQNMELSSCNSNQLINDPNFDHNNQNDINQLHKRKQSGSNQRRGMDRYEDLANEINESTISLVKDFQIDRNDNNQQIRQNLNLQIGKIDVKSPCQNDNMRLKSPKFEKSLQKHDKDSHKDEESLIFSNLKPMDMQMTSNIKTFQCLSSAINNPNHPEEDNLLKKNNNLFDASSMFSQSIRQFEEVVDAMMMHDYHQKLECHLQDPPYPFETVCDSSQKMPRIYKNDRNQIDNCHQHQQIEQDYKLMRDEISHLQIGNQNYQRFSDERQINPLVTDNDFADCNIQNPASFNNNHTQENNNQFQYLFAPTPPLQQQQMQMKNQYNQYRDIVDGKCVLQTGNAQTRLNRDRNEQQLQNLYDEKFISLDAKSKIIDISSDKENQLCPLIVENQVSQEKSQNSDYQKPPQQKSMKNQIQTLLGTKPIPNEQKQHHSVQSMIRIEPQSFVPKMRNNLSTRNQNNEVSSEKSLNNNQSTNYQFQSQLAQLSNDSRQTLDPIQIKYKSPQNSINDRLQKIPSKLSLQLKTKSLASTQILRSNEQQSRRLGLNQRKEQQNTVHESKSMIKLPQTTRNIDSKVKNWSVRSVGGRDNDYKNPLFSKFTSINSKPLSLAHKKETQNLKKRATRYLVRQIKAKNGLKYCNFQYFSKQAGN